MNIPEKFGAGDLGRNVEQFVEKLCTKSFLADFTVRSPKYRKAAGQEKEAADVFVCFRDTLLVFQVKSKVIADGNASDVSPIETARLSRAIDRACEQFHALLELWNQDDSATFTNGRGLDLAISKKDIKHVILMVVFAPVTAAGELAPFKFRVAENCHADDAIPLHLFSLSEFTTLSTVLNTFPDFLHYLNVRAYLHQARLVPADTDPVDIWALATFEKPRLLAAMDSKEPLNIAGLSDKHIESLRLLEEEEEPSYLIDWLIEELYAGINSENPLDQRLVKFARLPHTPGSVHAYQHVLSRLAQLTRSERCRLATEFVVRIDRSQTADVSFGGVIFERHDEGYLVIAAAWPRLERQAPAFNLGRAFAYRMKLKNVVCLVTGRNGFDADGCEAMFVDATEMTIDPAVQLAAAGLFDEPREG